MNIAETILNNIDNASLAVVRSIYQGIVTSNTTVITSMFALTFILFGYSLMMGWIQVPVKKLTLLFVKLTFIYALLFNWMFFQTIFYNVFTVWPDEIGGEILAATSAGGGAANVNDASGFSSFIGGLFDRGMVATGAALKSGGWFTPALLALVIGLSTVVLIVGIISIVVLSKIAISVLLALAPIFIIGLIFGITGKMFNSWLQQLINFVLTILITYAMGAFLIGLVDLVLRELILQGEDITASDVAPFAVVVFVMVTLIKQVLSIASAIAGGVAVSGVDLGRAAQSVASGVAAASTGVGAGVAAAKFAFASRDAVDPNRRPSRASAGLSSIKSALSKPNSVKRK